MTDERTGMPKTTGPVGRAVRLLLAAGFAYGFATLVDQGGPASIRDPETLTEVPFVVVTIAMAALYVVLVTELAKLVAGEAVAKTARSVALIVLGAAVAVTAVVGEVRSGAVCVAHRRRAGDARVRDRRLGRDRRAPPRSLCFAGDLHHRSPPPRRVGGPPPHMTKGGPPCLQPLSCRSRTPR
jgi:hypothetical protein